MTLKLAALLLITSGAIQQAKADECTLEISSNDAMQFDQSSMQAPASCSEVTVKLTHSGSLPANAMGHNWVLTTAADFQAVANAGMTAGLDNNYVPVDDARVLAATKIIGGGETTEVTFDTSGLSAGESYTFFCSFPGHWAIMKGEFTLAS
ncbi:MAG: azurin [Pseudomonadota bacterium]